MKRSAWISECENYRYRLSRAWGDGGLVYAFFGVNPSTADANIDDATVKKWVGFTDRNGGKSFIVGNAFAYRSKEVKDLAKCEDPTGGSANISCLRSIIKEADILVPCWGNTIKVPAPLRHHFSALMLELMESGKPVKIFGRTKSGDPKHPLMLGYNTELVDC